MEDFRQFAPATLRNRDAILEVLLQILPLEGNILEIASSTGEHSIYFAPRIFPRKWLPSDPNPDAIASITAWQQDYTFDNLALPIVIDVTDPDWSGNVALKDQEIRAIININMIHISPWTACLGLMAGAKNLLPVGGILYLYGAFKQNGQHISPGNVEFDASLRYQNPQWGVRDLEEVISVAAAQNLALFKVQTMPANNLSVVFQKCINL